MLKDTKIKGNYIESLWKFFASVRLTVVVLLLMAILSIIGTLIPQNEDPSEYFKAFGPFLYQFLATLDVFDMYHSWWFQSLMMMLVLNIVICSIDRLQTTGKIIFTKTPKFNLENYRRRKHRKNFYLKGNIQSVKDRFSALLSNTFSYCRVEQTDNGFAIMAEKGRLTRLGVYGVHLSVVILLIGSLIGSIYGFEGYANIAEGESSDTIQLRFLDRQLKLPFAIRCDDFKVQFYDTGAPKEFRSKLALIKGGKVVKQKEIFVNDPLRYEGINIFQSSYGKLDEAQRNIDISKEIELGFQSVASGMIYTVKTALKKPIEIPEGLGQLVLESYQPSAEFKGMAVGPSLKGTLTPKAGEPQSVLLPINFPKFDGMRKGKMIISVKQAGQISEDRYFTGLQITKDPGVDLVYAGFIIMILGCMVTFFMSHQQVVVEIQPKQDKIKVMVSGKANKNRVGFQFKLDRLARKLAGDDSSSNNNN